MSHAQRLAQAQLVVATSTAAGTVLVVLPPALDAFSLPKAALLVTGAVVVLLLGLWRTILRAEVSLPSAAAGTVLLVLVSALVYATVTSDAVTLSAVGRLGRYSGGLVYLAATVLTVVHARRGGARSVQHAAVAVLAAAALVSLLGVAWRLGLDPTGLEARSLRQPATLLGNSNFTGAIAGFGVVLGAGLLLLPASARRRVVTIGCLVACCGGVAVSGALQAAFATLGGLAIVLIGYLGSRDDAWASRGVPLTLGGCALAGVLAVLGTVGRGPLSLLAEQHTFQLRIDSWKAAWRMFVAEPLTGVGLDRFAAHYREFRPARAALTRSAEDFADAPHNVPLGMFASGGLVLGLAYLTVVLAVAVLAVRAWRRADAERRRLLGLAGGAWVAYHVQSTVSIDVPPLVALHGLFAGMVLSAAGGIAFHAHRLPWSPLERASRRVPPAGLRGRRPTPRRAGPEWTTVVGSTIAGVVLLAVLVVVSRPLRADVASYDAQSALDRGDVDDALAPAQRAQALSPWRPEYHVQEARAHVAAQDLTAALEALLDALERDPRDMDALVTAARASDRVGRAELSVQLYRRVLALEPQAPDLLREVAEALERNGHPAEAADVLARVRRLEA